MSRFQHSTCAIVRDTNIGEPNVEIEHASRPRVGIGGGEQRYLRRSSECRASTSRARECRRVCHRAGGTLRCVRPISIVTERQTIAPVRALQFGDACFRGRRKPPRRPRCAVFNSSSVIARPSTGNQGHPARGIRTRPGLRFASITARRPGPNDQHVQIVDKNGHCYCGHHEW